MSSSWSNRILAARARPTNREHRRSRATPLLRNVTRPKRMPNCSHPTCPNRIQTKSMSEYVVLLSIPGLRKQDLAAMPALSAAGARWRADGARAELSLRHLPGAGQHDHRPAAERARRRRQRLLLARQAAKSRCGPPGTTASSGRRSGTSLHEHDPRITSAVWFPLHSKGCGADYDLHAGADPQSRRQRVAVVLHEADGAVRRRCATRWATFRCKHFWGPMANIKSTAWIVDSAVHAAARASSRTSSTSTCRTSTTPRRSSAPTARRPMQALGELDADDRPSSFDGMRDGLRRRAAAVARRQRVRDHARSITCVYPNRVLREAGLLQVARRRTTASMLDFAASRRGRWSIISSRTSSSRRDAATIERVAELFRGQHGHRRSARPATSGPQYDLDHPRSGEVVLSSASQQLAGVLLVDRRRAGADVCPHGRHPPQAGLRPGRAVLRPGDQGHPARRHAGEGLARCAGPSRFAARRAPLQRSAACSSKAHGRHRCGRHRAAAVRNLNGCLLAGPHRRRLNVVGRTLAGVGAAAALQATDGPHGHVVVASDLAA